MNAVDAMKISLSCRKQKPCFSVIQTIA